MSRSNDIDVNSDAIEKNNKESASGPPPSTKYILANGEVVQGESESKTSGIGSVASPQGSDKSNEEPTHLSATKSPDKKLSRNLEDIDRTLDELHELTEDAYLTATRAQESQSSLFDRLFENSAAFLRKCETIPEDLSKGQFSDAEDNEDGIMEEVEEAVRDAEERLYQPNHVSAAPDTECSSDDEGGNQKNAALNDRHSIISGHERARSNDSRATSVFSSSMASFHRPTSHFSIDNSCFDIAAEPTQNSQICTPVEKMFVKNSCSAPEMRVRETKLPSPSPSNEATTTASDPSVSSEVSVSVDQPIVPVVANLTLCLNEGLTETASPVTSPVPPPRTRREQKTNQRMLEMATSSTDSELRNVPVNVLRPVEMEDLEAEEQFPNANRILEVISVSITNVTLARKTKKLMCILAKLDHKDVHRSAKLRSNNLAHDFDIEVTDSFCNLHLVVVEGSKAKVARPVGKVSIAKRDLELGIPRELTLKLCAVSRFCDFCGQVCLEVRRRPGSFSLRVVDFGGLKLKENISLLLLASILKTSTELGKLQIDTEEKRSKEWLEMPCGDGMLELKLTLWQDFLKGASSVFHGQVRVDVDPKWKSGPAKWFYLRAKTDEEVEPPEEAADIGDITVKATYQIDHILEMQYYKPLLDLLFISGEVQPLTASLVAVIEALPKVELGPISRSLVELMGQSDSIRPVLNSLYVNSILKCQDENTLFRGQSLSGKMLFEILTTYGKMYLINTLKPIIDKIYKERKTCEVDPARVVAGTSVDKNRANLLMYFQILFERIATSSSNCPHLIKQMLHDLRIVVGTHSGRQGAQRLAVSSFVIMRFFAAAVLNPKAFEVRKEQPDQRVSRTLLLLSKLLQRLSNCSVSEGPLSKKETWMNGVFETITSDYHLNFMGSFLDNISLHGVAEPELPTVFKFGTLQQVDRSRLAWKRILHKKRYAHLTETQLIWHKDMQCPPKGVINLADIKEVIVDKKNILTIVQESSQMQFEAPGCVEAHEWYYAIERQRHRVIHDNECDDPEEIFFFDAERHIDKIQSILYKYHDTLIEWRDQLQSDAVVDDKSTPELLKASYVAEDERDAHKTSLIVTLCTTIDVTETIQIARKEYETASKNKLKLEEVPTDL